MDMDKKDALRVAVYCRVATESQLGMDSQKEYLTQHALSLGHSNLAYYGDNGANGLTLDRPGFRQMDADIQAGKINAVLVKDISRIGRDVWQTLNWIEDMRRKDVLLITPGGSCELPTIDVLKNIYRVYASRTRTKQTKERK